MLEEKEEIITNHLQVVKINFIQIGRVFKEILQKQLYKELNFNSFEEYADNERFYKLFQMKSRHAFNMIELNDKFGNIQLQLLQSVGITKMIEIAHVTEKEMRGELLKQAPKMTVKQVEEKVRESKRFSSNIDAEVSEFDSQTTKFIRTGNQLLEDMTESIKNQDIVKTQFNEDIKNIETSLTKWLDMIKNTSNEEITNLKAKLLIARNDLKQ